MEQSKVVVKEKARVSVLVPKHWSALIRIRAEELGFMTISDYIQHLLRLDLLESGYLETNHVSEGTAKPIRNKSFSHTI